MGFQTVVPSAGVFNKRKADHEALFRSIHRAMVLDVNVEEGTMSVRLEKVANTYQVTIPLVGFNVPASVTDPKVEDYSKSSWGRYIPQKGSFILAGFGSDGTLYALGYTAIFYGGLAGADKDQESEGGIGWSDPSAKTVKPGDWDFKSSRNATFYLGEKAVISSGPCSVVLNQSTGELTSSADVIKDNAGCCSTLKFGTAKRMIFPSTDMNEQTIITPRVPPNAQEFTVDVKCLGAKPEGNTLAMLSLGDVVDEKVNNTIKLSLNTAPQPVKYFLQTSDITGYIPTWDETVDALGNYYNMSKTGIEYTWLTLLAAWDIKNLSTAILSTESIDLHSVGPFTITGEAGVVLDSKAVIQLGGVTAAEPMVLGNKWYAFVSALLTALGSHTHEAAGVPTTTSAAFSAAITGLLSSATAAKSVKVMGA